MAEVYVSEYEIERRNARRKEMEECRRIRKEERAKMTPGQILTEKLGIRRAIFVHKAMSLRKKAEQLRERAERIERKSNQIEAIALQFDNAIFVLSQGGSVEVDSVARVMKLK